MDYPPPPPFIYGHVHMSKTAGTELNGMLAVRYERVCGHKGYSYDAFQTNLRARESGTVKASYVANDSFNQLGSVGNKWNRGRVPFQVMDEIGLEDCDYISQESHWMFWTRWQDLWRDWPLELHVPCRDRVEHLLSNCNHVHHQFQCQPSHSQQVSVEFFKEQIERCSGNFMNRFSMQLETTDPNIHVKCYDFGKQFNEYSEYLDRRLQKRRIEATYFHRETNPPRNKTAECLWSDDKARQAVSDLLLEMDYYNFCDRCLGSENDLFALVE